MKWRGTSFVEIANVDVLAVPENYAVEPFMVAAGIMRFNSRKT